MTEIENLRFIRIIDPVHIPKHLVEQIRDREFTVDRFYDYQRSICVDHVDNGIQANMLNLLFVIVDDENKVQGFAWMVIDVLCNALFINTFSIEKIYWGGGKAVELLKRKAIEIMEGAKLPKCYWMTNHPKHSERYGFKRAKTVLMQYTGEDDDGKGIRGEQSEANRIGSTTNS